MSKSNETTVLSVYVSNTSTGYIIHRLDLVEKYKKEVIHELELLTAQLKQENK